MTLPHGFQRSQNPVIARLSDDEAAPVIERAHFAATARERNEALARLRDAAIWPAIGWEGAPLRGRQFDPEAAREPAPQAAAAPIAPATESAAAPPITADIDLSKCGGGRSRCAYGPDGGCTHKPCGKRRQRAPKRKITLPEQPAALTLGNPSNEEFSPSVDVVHAAPLGAAAGPVLGGPAGGTHTGTAPSNAGSADDARTSLPEHFAADRPTPPPSEPSASPPIPPTDAAALSPVGAVSALPQAAPATPTHLNTETNDAALEDDGRPGLSRGMRPSGPGRDLHDQPRGAGHAEAGRVVEVGPEAGDLVHGQGQAPRLQRDERHDDLADVRPEDGGLGREADHAVPDHGEVEGAGRGGDPGQAVAAPKRSARRRSGRSAADGDRGGPVGAVAGGAGRDPGAGAGRGGSGAPLPRGLTEPVRFSHLKTLGTRSPAHFKANVEVEETASMERGTAVHAMALGTRRVVAYPGKQRRGAEWEAFEAANADADILTEAAYETARAMADALLAHPVFAAGLADARRRGGVEHTILWKHLGVPCRSTPDLWTPDWVADVKTSRTSDPREWEFPRMAIRSHYHAQLAWYAEALRSTKLAPALRYHYIFAVEATPPYVVTVFRLTSAEDVDRNGRPGAVEDGDKTWRRWFEALRVCLDSDVWPTYSAVTCEIDVEQEMPALTFGADDQDGDKQEEIAA